MVDQDEYIVEPEQGENNYGIICPDCGNRITPPHAGHVWTCHETYGGCGEMFHPVDAFKRVEDKEEEQY